MSKDTPKYPGEKCGLSEDEWEMEQIVDQIKRVTTLEGIGILRRFSESPPDAGKEQEAVQDELWNDVAALTNGVAGHRFYIYPNILDELKSKYHITKKP